ncbi:hypothetical protein PR048_016386 [Dryococelus australis]|uniref:Uncharacterized protein n=1 Tax=Dryococelus australis TaxID=614101 RepID=A0ABQ9HK12_9NEOP|nr:hypothetical protein PR048_016386 [Dryococelus australis]
MLNAFTLLASFPKIRKDFKINVVQKFRCRHREHVANLLIYKVFRKQLTNLRQGIADVQKKNLKYDTHGPPQRLWNAWSTDKRAMQSAPRGLTRNSSCRATNISLTRSPPTKTNRVHSPPGSPVFCKSDRAGRCRWSAGFLGDLSFPQPLHSGDAPNSLQSHSAALKNSLLRATQISSLNNFSNSLQDVQLDPNIPEREVTYVTWPYQMKTLACQPNVHTNRLDQPANQTCHTKLETRPTDRTK